MDNMINDIFDFLEIIGIVFRGILGLLAAIILFVPFILWCAIASRFVKKRTIICKVIYWMIHIVFVIGDVEESNAIAVSLAVWITNHIKGGKE